MYTIGNKTYADAGYYLKRGSSIAYSMTTSNDIQEVPVTLDDMHRVGEVILWSDDKLAQRVIKRGTYADYKKAIIQKKYSNDDQIAIILNKDTESERDIMAYNKMQEWREWASILAHLILSL